MLQGNHITLRPMERTDLPRLWEFAQDLDLGLLTGSDGRPISHDAVDRIFEERWTGRDADAVRWAIDAHGIVVGGVELAPIHWRNRSAELAVWIGDAVSRRRGFGLDAMQVALTYAFRTLGLHRVSYLIPEANQAALAAYLRAGFREEGHLRQAAYRDGRYHDLIGLGILRDEWEAHSD
jgi:RimJ/RimL family protein N-acetyltransferase